MTFPEWTKPGIYGALVGAVAISIFGFSWAGWTTGQNAQKMASEHAAKEVTLAMVPLCVNLSEADPEREAKLALIGEASGFARQKAVMDTGWATPPGADAPSRTLAAACFDSLELGGS